MNDFSVDAIEVGLVSLARDMESEDFILFWFRGSDFGNGIKTYASIMNVLKFYTFKNTRKWIDNKVIKSIKCKKHQFSFIIEIC